MITSIGADIVFKGYGPKRGLGNAVHGNDLVGEL